MNPSLPLSIPHFPRKTSSRFRSPSQSPVKGHLSQSPVKYLDPQLLPSYFWCDLLKLDCNFHDAGKVLGISMGVSHRDNSPQTHWKLSIILFDLTRKFSTVAHFAISSKGHKTQVWGLKPRHQACGGAVLWHHSAHRQGAAVWRFLKHHVGMKPNHTLSVIRV